ncbi:MAG TPA: SurA N-terminal domain-containing protein [Methylomirabilota bacterium]|nr:SurA N-terminal domain-containing protein [Methylomirabilota bacterium]
MLDALRRGATTWVAKILLGLLIASFAVWGVADVFRLGGGAVIAEVGDTEIEATAFQRAYTRQLQAMSRQMGQPVDRDFAVALGLPQQVLGQLMSDATLTAAARDMGLGVSDEALAREIADDPNLRPPGAGSFDRGYFTRLLRENGMTEADYIADRRLFSIRSQLTEALIGGLTPPPAYVELFDRYRSETRSIEYVVLETGAAGAVPVPTESDLTTWFEANKGDFQAPEYRDVSVLAVTPETMADPTTVDDAAARAEYDRTIAAFTTPERRRVRQVLFPTAEEARAAAERIANGVSLDAVIADRGLSLDDVDLGMITREEIVDPAIADVAFSVEAGVVSEPIEARFGGALIEVTEIEAEIRKPFEEVKDEVKRTMAARDADRLVADTYDEIEDARAGGATLAEIAQRFSLPLITVKTDVTGLDTRGDVIASIPQSADVLRAAFSSEEGDETDPVRAGGGFVWFSLDGVTPAQDRPMSEVRADVVAAWTAEQVSDQLADKAEELAEAVRRGGDFAALAATAGMEIRTAADLTRASQAADFGPVGLEAVFEGPSGHVAAVDGHGETQVVLKVTDVTVPPFFPEAADSTQIAGQLRGQIGESLLTQYIDETQKALGTSINQQVLQTAIGTPTL